MTRGHPPPGPPPPGTPPHRVTTTPSPVTTPPGPRTHPVGRDRGHGWRGLPADPTLRTTPGTASSSRAWWSPPPLPGFSADMVGEVSGRNPDERGRRRARAPPPEPSAVHTHPETGAEVSGRWCSETPVTPGGRGSAELERHPPPVGPVELGDIRDASPGRFSGEGVAPGGILRVPAPRARGLTGRARRRLPTRPPGWSPSACWVSDPWGDGERSGAGLPVAGVRDPTGPPVCRI